ncbi:MAG: 50S ribosomal protein L24 [Chlamydia sp.]
MLTKAKQGSKKVRAGDKIIVIAGNSKGQTGTVLACIGDKVFVQGVNLCKKHVKRSQQHPQGGFVEIERPIHVSNVCTCDEAGRPLKLKMQMNEANERELYYIQDGQRIIYRSIKRSKK